MKFSHSLALASIASFSSVPSAYAFDEAEVYILTANHKPPTSIPSLPRQLTRQILLHRLGNGAQLSDTRQVIDDERALSHIVEYSHSPKPLFETAPSEVADKEQIPAQLVVLLEGVTDKNSRLLKETIRRKYGGPSFVVADPPTSAANTELVDELSIRRPSASCDIVSAMALSRKSCWRGDSLVLRYDAAEDERLLDTTTHEISAMLKLVNAHALETVLMLIPESSRATSHKHWSTNPPSSSELRRRAFDNEFPEEPLTSISDSSDSTSSSAPAGVPGQPFKWAAVDPKAKIPACFQSLNSCATATGNCTGHGVCRNRYAVRGKEDGADGALVCFTCSCLSTLEGKSNAKHTHWGGNMCQKIDVSSPFWMLAGVSIVLVGVVTFSIGLLFSVGEEKLPGVIGAGVSRSK